MANIDAFYSIVEGKYMLARKKAYMESQKSKRRKSRLKKKIVSRNPAIRTDERKSCWKKPQNADHWRKLHKASDLLEFEDTRIRNKGKKRRINDDRHISQGRVGVGNSKICVAKGHGKGDVGKISNVEKQVAGMEEKINIGSRLEKGKRAVVSVKTVTSLSSDNKSDTDISVHSYEPVEESDFESEEFMWERIVKCGETMRKNVLQIPKEVIRKCLSQPQSKLEIFDTDTEKSYDCELREREEKFEKFLARGWYEFAEDKRLKRGDKLIFCLKYPPATRLLVCMENKSDSDDDGV